MSSSPDRAKNSVCNGIEFLHARQLENGQFPIEMTTLSNGVVSTEPDEALFATAHIVYSIGFCENAIATIMVKRSLNYFRNEMTGHGLWRHWNKSSMRGNRKLYPFIPADLDDMANISYLLRRHGVEFPDNRKLFLLNRNRDGLFYTWLMLRPTFTLNLRYWQTVISEFNIPRFTIFWKVTEAGYSDVDGVVNANVLLYLGKSGTVRPVVDWLCNVVRSGQEAECDKWYRDIFTFHYALSRLYLDGNSSFQPIRDVAIERMNRSAHPGGCIGENVLHTALAVSTLLNYGAANDTVEHAIGYMLDNQDSDGSWPAYPYYYGGPLKVAHWGSRELTTGLCLEALQRAVLAGQNSNG